MRKRNSGEMKLYATMPDGVRIARTTKRLYLFVVCIRERGDQRWGWVRWTTRHDLAEKELRAWLKIPTVEEIEIVPVEVV